MATEIIKSTAIANYDAVPVFRNAAGVGADYTPKRIDSRAPVTSGVTSPGSYYRMARVRSDVRIKKVEMWLDVAGTTITGDIGLYYSDSQNQDGTSSPNNLGTVINQDHFASAVALATIVVPTDYTFEAGTYLGADTQLPLWNTTQSGLTTNPMGFFDIVFTLTATAGSAGVLNMRVTYADPS